MVISIICIVKFKFGIMDYKTEFEKFSNKYWKRFFLMKEKDFMVEYWFERFEENLSKKEYLDEIYNLKTIVEYFDKNKEEYLEDKKFEEQNKIFIKQFWKNWLWIWPNSCKENRRKFFNSYENFEDILKIDKKDLFWIFKNFLIENWLKDDSKRKTEFERECKMWNFNYEEEKVKFEKKYLEYFKKENFKMRSFLFTNWFDNFENFLKKNKIDVSKFWLKSVVLLYFSKDFKKEFEFLKYFEKYWREFSYQTFEVREKLLNYWFENFEEDFKFYLENIKFRDVVKTLDLNVLKYEFEKDLFIKEYKNKFISLLKPEKELLISYWFKNFQEKVKESWIEKKGINLYVFYHELLKEWDFKENLYNFTNYQKFFKRFWWRFTMMKNLRKNLIDYWFENFMRIMEEKPWLENENLLLFDVLTKYKDLSEKEFNLWYFENEKFLKEYKNFYFRLNKEQKEEILNVWIENFKKWLWFFKKEDLKLWISLYDVLWCLNNEKKYFEMVNYKKYANFFQWKFYWLKNDEIFNEILSIPFEEFYNKVSKIEIFKKLNLSFLLNFYKNWETKENIFILNRDKIDKKIRSEFKKFYWNKKIYIDENIYWKLEKYGIDKFIKNLNEKIYILENWDLLINDIFHYLNFSKENYLKEKEFQKFTNFWTKWLWQITKENREILIKLWFNNVLKEFKKRKFSNFNDFCIIKCFEERVWNKFKLSNNWFICKKCKKENLLNSIIFWRMSRDVELTSLCLHCIPKTTKRSLWEIEVFNFISEIYNGTIRENPRILKNKESNRKWEIDIFLEELNLWFEYNWEFYHSWYFSEDKTEEKIKYAKEIWIDLFVIWEKDWKNNKKETKKFILEKIKERI